MDSPWTILVFLCGLPMVIVVHLILPFGRPGGTAGDRHLSDDGGATVTAKGSEAWSTMASTIPMTSSRGGSASAGASIFDGRRARSS
jgi:hypothetical protein